MATELRIDEERSILRSQVGRAPPRRVGLGPVGERLHVPVAALRVEVDALSRARADYPSLDGAKPLRAALVDGGHQAPLVGRSRGRRPRTSPREGDSARPRPLHSFSTWCTRAMAVDPSPTADATRFWLPLRTSPTANTPGRLVSRRWGARDSGHFAAVSSSRERSGPVLMNPLSSSTTQPASQRVAGSAPVITNTCPSSRRSTAIVRLSRQRTASR